MAQSPSDQVINKVSQIQLNNQNGEEKLWQSQVEGEGGKNQGARPTTGRWGGGIQNQRAPVFRQYKKWQKQDPGPQVISSTQVREVKAPLAAIGLGGVLVAMLGYLVWGSLQAWPGVLAIVPEVVKKTTDRVVLASPLPKPAKLMVGKGLANLGRQQSWQIAGEGFTPGWVIEIEGAMDRRGKPKAAVGWQMARRGEGGEKEETQLTGKFYSVDTAWYIHTTQANDLPGVGLRKWQGQLLKIPLVQGEGEWLSSGQLGLIRVRQRKLSKLWQRYVEMIAERAKREGNGRYRSYLTGEEVIEVGETWLAIMEEGQPRLGIPEQWSKTMFSWGKSRLEDALVKVEVSKKSLMVERLELVMDWGGKEIRLRLNFSQFGKGEPGELPQGTKEATRISLSRVVDFDYLISLLPENQDAKRKADLQVIANVLETYRENKGEYPESLEMLSPDYLNPLPRDAARGQLYNYRLTKGGEGYKLSAILSTGQVWSMGR